MKFEECCKSIINCENISNETQLALYGLYKQSMFGDVSGTKPSIFDQRARYKFIYWEKCKGMSEGLAKKKYCVLVESLL